MAQRRLEKFPTTFERVTRAALNRIEKTTVGGEPLVSVKLDTVGQCINLQMDLRQYWNKLSDYARGGLTVTIAGIDDIAPRAAMLACRFKKGDKTTLEIIHRNQMIGSLRLAAALGALEESLAGLDSEDPEKKKKPALPEAPGLDPASQAILESFPPPKEGQK